MPIVYCLYTEKVAKRVNLKLSVLTTKRRGSEEIFGDVVCVHYLDCGNGFTSVCDMFKPIKLGTLNVHRFFVNKLHFGKAVKKYSF